MILNHHESIMKSYDYLNDKYFFYFNDSNPLFAKWTGSGFEPSITLAEDSLITGCYKQRVTEWSFSINTSHESNLTLKYWQPFPSIRPTVCTITTKICVLLTLDMSDQDTIKLQWFIGGLRLSSRPWESQDVTNHRMTVMLLEHPCTKKASD